MRKITDKQKAVLNFIRDYQNEKGNRPTYQEIADHLKLSVPGVASKIDSLYRKKAISLKNIYIINDKII